MQTHRALAPVLVLLALAVGYLAGMGRQGSQEGAASAGPVTLETPNTPLLTSSEDGASLFVWQLSNGIPVGASRYHLRADWVKDVDGKEIDTSRIWVSRAAVPALPPSPK